MGVSEVRVGVDALSWLHKGSYGCALGLLEGKDPTVYFIYHALGLTVIGKKQIFELQAFELGTLWN